MKTRTFQYVSVLVATGALLGGGLAACSSDSGSNTKPSVHPDNGVANEPDATAPAPVTTDDSGLAPIDASLPDVGNCTSDSGNCNSCYTVAQDPVNGCSSAAANCIKFDDKRVPANVP